jgi:hypothetical protein
MDLVAGKLQVVAEVEAARGVPEAFPADNKEELHGTQVTEGGLLRFPPIGRRGCWSFFGDDDPGDEIEEEPRTQGKEGSKNPEQPDDGRVHIDVFTDTAADPPEDPLRSRTVQPFHG